MVMHEDFADEPSVEERMPHGLSPAEMKALHDEASVEDCEFCGESFHYDELVPTGHYEYYTMDLDPGTRICADCLERRREDYTPSDPALFDCYMPVQIG